MTGWRWNALRAAFLVAVLAGAWLSWHDSGADLTRALATLDVSRVIAATFFVVLGLVATGGAWQLALGAFNVRMGTGSALSVFFVGQLGKYIPGSVWTFAAQGVLGRRHGVPPRSAAAASVLFLGVHVASGLVFAGVIGWGSEIPGWVVAASLLTGLFGLTPALYRILGQRLSGQDCQWSMSRSAAGLGVMLPTWICYTAALVSLSPKGGLTTALALGSAFAIAYAVGVAVPLAPAGLGAREVALVALLSPVLGVGQATMLALVARLIHAIADVVVAGAFWLLLRLSLRRGVHEQVSGEH